VTPRRGRPASAEKVETAPDEALPPELRRPFPPLPSRRFRRGGVREQLPDAAGDRFRGSPDRRTGPPSPGLPGKRGYRSRPPGRPRPSPRAPEARTLPRTAGNTNAFAPPNILRRVVVRRIRQLHDPPFDCGGSFFRRSNKAAVRALVPRRSRVSATGTLPQGCRTRGRPLPRSRTRPGRAGQRMYSPGRGTLPRAGEGTSLPGPTGRSPARLPRRDRTRARDASSASRRRRRPPPPPERRGAEQPSASRTPLPRKRGIPRRRRKVVDEDDVPARTDSGTSGPGKRNSRTESRKERRTIDFRA
jgi:hypothetical protein